MINLRLREIARRPDAPFLGAQAGTDSIGRTLELFEIEAAVPENGSPPDSTRSCSRPGACSSSASAPRS